MKKSDNKSRIELYKGIVSLRTLNECASLFNDIFTEKELDLINQRYQIAKLLTMGFSYREISEITHAGSATISRVNKSLIYGNGGLAKIFERR